MMNTACTGPRLTSGSQSGGPCCRAAPAAGIGCLQWLAQKCFTAARLQLLDIGPLTCQLQLHIPIIYAHMFMDIDESALSFLLCRDGDRSAILQTVSEDGEVSAAVHLAWGFAATAGLFSQELEVQAVSHNICLSSFACS